MKFVSLPLTQQNFQLLDTYQAALPHSQFLQSSRWAEFQKSQGRQVILFSNEEQDILGIAIRNEVIAGKSYWYIPRAPYIENAGETTMIVSGLKGLFREIDPTALFIRFDPVGNVDAKNLLPTIDVQPKRTLTLKLEGPEEKILAGMHQKTRYNIRLAEKKRLQIRKGSEYIGEFFKLLEETKTRDGFRLHHRSYYEAMVKSGAVELATIWHEDTMLAGNLMAYFGDTATYVHGASSSQQRSLMAPYALHWHLIKNACDAGYLWYDWHGIDEKKWPGVTRFKKGFGGEEIDYSGTFDLPLAPLGYRLYTIIRYVRRLL